MQALSLPAAAANRHNNPTRRRRRLPDLTLPIPQRDTSLADPLPPTSVPSIAATQLVINFSDLDRLNRIGSGYVGTVYKVLHRPSGNLYALKVIHGNHNDSVRRQICREIQILRDVDNPSIVKCHDMFDVNGEIQVLFEYMDRGSLEGTHIHDEASLSDLTRQILSGLYYLHRHRIVHRDIKPSNLLINSRKQVKIADFGVSRILSQTMDPCNSSVGTMAYMSPERIDTDFGKSEGYAGDIWGLGVSILEFYLGRFPFAVGRQGDWASLMCAICLSQPPEAPPTASREFRDFIACCLQRDPAKRWTALQLLSHPFILQNKAGGAGNNQNNKQETKLELDLLDSEGMQNAMKTVAGISGHLTPDKQDLFAPDPKSAGEKDLESLQMQVRQSPVVVSDQENTMGIAPGGHKRKRLDPDHDSTMGTAPEVRIVTTKRLEETCSDPREFEESNSGSMEVSPTISDHFSILHEIDLSDTAIKSLPQSISILVALKKLSLRSCKLLRDLPPEIGELMNLEVLDLEGTEIFHLPKEIAKLVNLTCLKVSFYGYANQTVIPRRVLSNLLRLKELIIDVTPYGDWWDVEVETILDDLCSLKELRNLKLNLPTTELLEKLILICPCLANFRFTVGRHQEHFISRLPYGGEKEFNDQKKLDKGLKYINGNSIPNGIAKVFKHADAFFLQCHWTAKSLSEFGHENMNEVKYCLVMECNEFQTIIDTEQFHQGKEVRSESEAIALGSLEKLIIRYMKNMESIWNGSVGKRSLSNLNSLALHTCPNLTTLFTIDMLMNLTNLEELIVEDCPKINSLVSLKSSDSKSGLFLPKLKKISLLELPEMVSISSGLRIAPNLERMVIFYCPKLEKLSTMDVSSTKLKVIKGEKEWWDALRWYESDLSTEQEDYLARHFIPLWRSGDLMAQLTKD